MNVIVCLDDNNGMMFNRRRQSTDAVLIRRVIQLIGNAKLWVSDYSAKLFAETDICVSRDFLEKAGVGEYCFVEDADLDAVDDRIERIIIYRWNRRYPSDRRFSLSLDGWCLVHIEEFAGKSHPVITEEVYVR